jgi:hypothetical protein
VTTERFSIAGGPFERLFEAWAAGAYTLPDGIIRAAIARRELFTAREAARLERERFVGIGAEQDYRIRSEDALIAAVRDTGAVPVDPWAPIRDYRRQAAEAEGAFTLARETALRAEGQFEAAIHAGADGIISGHMRPAFDAIVGEARKLLPPLAGVDVTSTASVSAGGPAASAAYLELSALAMRYQTILTGRANLARVVRHDRLDEFGWFADSRALPDPRGVAATIASPTVRGAGPRDLVARLLWLASEDGKPFLTTLTQQDEIWTRWNAWRGLAGRDPLRGGPGLAAAVKAAREAAEAAV